MDELFLRMLGVAFAALAGGVAFSWIGPKYLSKGGVTNSQGSRTSDIVPGIDLSAQIPPREQVLKELANSGIDVASSAFFPRWHCWGIMENERLRGTLQHEFGGRLIGLNWSPKPDYIIALTNEAASFLEPVSTRKLLPAPVITMAEAASLKASGLQLIVFDLNINTGSTVQTFVTIATKEGWRINSYWFILFNDVIPDDQLVKPTGPFLKAMLEGQSDLDNPGVLALHRASRLEKYWRPKRPNISRKRIENTQKLEEEYKRFVRAHHVAVVDQI